MKNFFAIHKREIILFVAILLALIPLFPMEYATDTYVIGSRGIKEYSKTVFDSARPVTALFMLIVGSVWENITFLYYVSFTISVISIFFSIYFLSGAFEKYTGKYATLLSILIVVNPLLCEYFLFIEKGMFSLAILFCILALKCYIHFCDGKWAFLILGSLFIGLCSLIYQPICGLFVPLVVLYISLNNKEIKKFVIKLLWAVLLYGIGLTFDLVFLLAFAKGERAGKIHFENLKSTFLFAGVWQSILIYLCAFAILFLLSWVLTRKACNDLTKELFIKSTLILVSTVCAVFLPFILTEPNEVWFPFRIVYPLGATIGAISLLYVYFLKDHVSIKRVGIVILCIFLSLELVFFEIMFVSRVINTKRDKELCYKIGEEISSYEEKNGIEIKNVSIYHDKSITHRNKGVLKIGDSNVRAFSKSWSDVNSLNVILDKDYQKVAQSKEIKEYFSEMDWQTYNSQQLIFVGDTLHLCIY